MANGGSEAAHWFMVAQQFSSNSSIFLIFPDHPRKSLLDPHRAFALPALCTNTPSDHSCAVKNLRRHVYEPVVGGKAGLGHAFEELFIRKFCLRPPPTSISLDVMRVDIFARVQTSVGPFACGSSSRALSTHPRGRVHRC